MFYHITPIWACGSMPFEKGRALTLVTICEKKTINLRKKLKINILQKITFQCCYFNLFLLYLYKYLLCLLSL